MKDKDFLEIMGANGIAFGKGDTIVADIETLVGDGLSGGRPKYNIVKAATYPRYTKITKSSGKQGQLFGDSE